MFTGEGFSPYSGFRNLLCSQEMHLVLFKVYPTNGAPEKYLKHVKRKKKKDFGQVYDLRCFFLQLQTYYNLCVFSSKSLSQKYND